MKKYEIFLFDADGTLFDFDKAEVYALKTVFNEFGLSYTENILSKYRQINLKLWESFEKREITIEDIKTSRFIQLFNETGICCGEKNFSEKFLYELGHEAFLIDGALEICQEIVSQGKKIYIVTNGFAAVQESRIKHSAIGKYISNFFASESVGFQKPYKQYFDYVFSRIPQIEKSKILMVGDSLSTDIAGGNNAGIDGCWLNISGIKNNTGIMPAYEISSLKELKPKI